MSQHDCEFVPVIDKEVELDPLLGVVCECREFFENEKNDTHRQNNENAKYDKETIQVEWQSSLHSTSSPRITIYHF